MEAIFARSEGNPFYAEELLQAAQAGSLELPATLHDLLRGRVDALPQAARHVLAVVAMAGRCPTDCSPPSPKSRTPS